MMPSFSELAGDFSDEALAFEVETREGLGVKGLPGLGISEETDQAFEHRMCKKCGEVDARERVEEALAADDVPDGQLTATVSFHFGPGDDGRLEAVVVDFAGDMEGLVFLPAAYLDKILFNARLIRGAADGTLQRVSDFIDALGEARRSDQDVILHGGLPVQDERPSEPDATIDVGLVFSESSRKLGAITHFKPHKAENETIAEYGFFALWDAIAPMLSQHGLDQSIEKLQRLCLHYREHGAPKMRELGSAPYEAWSV